MTLINAALALLVAAGLAASAYGWRHSLQQPERSAEWFFALAKVLYSLGFGFLMLMWGAVWDILRISDPEAAMRMLDSPLSPYANAAGMLVVLSGIYASLRARQMLIPAAERGNWPWWIAWLHPNSRLRRR